MDMAISRAGEEPISKIIRSTQEVQERADDDRISQLPDPLLRSILSLLTLKESCITTTLSKRWSPLFPSLPRLAFHDFSFSFSSKSVPSWEHEVDIDRWLDSVCDVLESRRAPVESCSIDSEYFDQYSEEFGNVVRFLCNDGVQNLNINNTGEHYTVPFCLFSCRTLNLLELYKCRLAVPSKFAGLRRLRTLQIEECIAEDDDLERLISCCRAVERMELLHCYRVRSLVVRAHKLAVLKISTHRPLAISIIKAPRLECVTVKFEYDYPDMFQTYLEKNPEDLDDYTDGTDDEDDDTDESEVSRIVRLLEGLGNIQNLSLEFQNRFLKRLTKQRMPVPAILPAPSRLQKLKKLNLKMQLSNGYLVSIVSCLLNSSPKLEDLVIGDNNAGKHGYSEITLLDYWDKQIPSDCIRNWLTTVTLYLEERYFYKYWIKFIKFLLTNARVLKKMVINYRRKEENQPEFRDFQREMFLLQPASPDAIVELKPTDIVMFYF